MEHNVHEHEVIGDTHIDEEEKMVRFELEAAEALAGLAHSARPQLPMASQSTPPTLDDDHDHDESLQSSDDNHLPQGGAAVVREELPEKLVCNGGVKDELQEEVCCRSFNICVGSGSSKSMQPLTETEKEARRLRRVLANRESARQTIRRRQAMFEELSKKAYDLALENENLKKEKELAVKEYDSLTNTNDCLKEQMAKMVKTKAEEIQKETRTVHSEFPASASASTPFFPYNQPSVVPFPWPSIIQPLEATLLQCRSQNDNANPSVFPATQTWRPNLFPDQRESTTIATPRALLYVLPFPCFFPLHSPPTAPLSHSSNPIDIQNETRFGNQCRTGSPSKSIGENSQSSLNSKIKTETYSSAVIVPGDEHQHHQAGIGIPTEGGYKGEGTYPIRNVLMPTPLNCVRPSTSAGGGLNITLQREDSSEEAIFSVTGHTEENQKPADAGTGAEARKRRRELMKLKSIQSGQFHMP